MHLFRHAGGKIFLDAKPGKYEVVRRVLGHKSLATTTSIYTGAETRSAGQLFAKVINERRIDIEAELKTKQGKKNARSMATIKHEAVQPPQQGGQTRTSSLQSQASRTPPNGHLHWAADKGVKS